MDATFYLVLAIILILVLSVIIYLQIRTIKNERSFAEYLKIEMSNDKAKIRKLQLDSYELKKKIEEGTEFLPKFDDNGLITAIAQDAESGQVLMVAYMNKEALDMTIATGVATYFSRSRAKLWKKGESSGNVQKVKAIFKDCDSDTLLIKVEQVGGAACHTGNRSCFFSESKKGGGWIDHSNPLFDPKKVYPNKK